MNTPKNPLLLGIPAGIDHHEYRRLLLVNILTLIGVLANTFYFVLLYNQGYHMHAFINAPGIVLTGVGAYFMHSQRFLLAKIYNLLMIPLCMFFPAMIYGDIGLNGYFVTLAMVAFFILDNKWHIYPVLAAILGMMVLMNYSLEVGWIKPVDNELAKMSGQFVWINLLIGFFASVVFVGVFKSEIRRYELGLRERNEHILQQKEELQAANERLEDQKTEIIAQAHNLQETNDLLYSKNAEITQHRDEIEAKNRNILASITYAKRIQEAVLPNAELLEAIFPQHFLLYQPRDLVSGDFYFAKSYKNYRFLAAADCTGHGVPGAFMSMLSMTLLNELIRRPDIQSAGQLLDELRFQLKLALQQTKRETTTQDGLDIAFISIDVFTNRLNFAGANNPLWVFRDGQLTEIKGDSMPVGVYPRERHFTNHEFQLQAGDTLYLFTDGYHSQFRHRTEEKLKIKRFRDLLAALHTQELAEQRRYLVDFLDDWRGTQRQIDDILVIGLRV